VPAMALPTPPASITLPITVPEMMAASLLPLMVMVMVTGLVELRPLMSVTVTL